MFKKANLIKPPHKMVEEITRIVRKAYAARVLGSDNSQDVLEEAKKYTQIPLLHDKTLYSQILINLDGWELMQRPNIVKKITEYNEIAKMHQMPLFQDILSQQFYLTIRFNTKDTSRGHYYSVKNNDKLPYFSISMNLPNSHNIKKIFFTDIMLDLKMTVEHELIHWVQDILTRILFGNIPYIARDEASVGYQEPSFGFPPKKYKSEHDYVSQRNIPHAQRDVEFYTNLNNIIKTVLHFAKDFPEQDKIHYFKEIVGVNGIEKSYEPFTTLLKNKDPKYRLACKIFWKELMKSSGEDK